MFPHEHNRGCECARFFLIQDNVRLFEEKNRYPENILRWDPWPVRKYYRDGLVGRIQALVLARNETSSHHAMDAIDILPASSYGNGIHGGSIIRGLYSVRSPSMLPFKVHIWEITGGKIMLRRGLKTQPLSNFLNDLGCFEWKDEVARLEFWKPMPFRDQFMAMVNPSEELFQKVSLAWHTANPFRLLDLPAEIREIILCFALGIRLNSKWRYRLPQMIASCYTTLHNSSSRLTLQWCTNTSLLSVNKQIHEDLRAVVSTNVTISFRDPHIFSRFLEQDFQKTSLLTRPMRYIQLAFPEARQFLGLFGRPSNQPRQFEYYNEAGFELRTMIDADDDLAWKGICIRLPHAGRPFKRKPLDEQRELRVVCQHVLNEDILIGARPLLCKVRLVVLKGHISPAQKERWLEKIIEYRKDGTSMTPEELYSWQQDAWRVNQQASCSCSPSCNPKRKILYF